MIEYIWSNKESGLTPVSGEEYRNSLIDLPHDVAKRAFEKAWETRNFEIEMYWRRATYFWAFIASTFVGYLALVGSENYSKPDVNSHVEVYMLICIGFVLSCAWLLTNIGSKSWQRHWEVHVDLLENRFTGPLYKTVYPTETFSVSKINEIVSAVFAGVWLLLGIKYLVNQDLLNFNFIPSNMNWFVFLFTTLALLAVLAMVKGHGRGRFGKRPVHMHRRSVIYESGEKS